MSPLEFQQYQNQVDRAVESKFGAKVRNTSHDFDNLKIAYQITSYRKEFNFLIGPMHAVMEFMPMGDIINL